MKVNEKVVLALIGLLTLCIEVYRDISLAEINANKEVDLAQTRNNLEDGTGQ